MKRHSSANRIHRPCSIPTVVVSCILAASVTAPSLSAADAAAGDAQLLADAQAALQQEPANLLAPVVVFPAVNLDNKIRPSGVLLSRLAQYKIAYAPRRRMAIGVNYLAYMLWHHEITDADTVLDEAKVKACLAGLKADSYVIPRLSENANGWTLTLDLHKADTAAPQQVTHQMAADEVGRVPGLIAIEVLKHFGIETSAEQQAALNQPVFREEADLVFIEQVVRDGLSDLQNEQRLRQFLQQYPTNVPGWEAWIRRSNDPQGVIEEYEGRREGIQCERLEIEAAIKERELARPREALLRLLPLAPTEHGDVYYYAALTKTALALGDAPISKLALSEWKRVGNSYLDCCLRGEMLVDWAWQARGSDWAINVEPEAWELFGNRIAAARAELEQAVEVDPNGFGAHTQLIGVAKALSLPYEYMNEHFEAAVRLRPSDPAAYEAKLEFLRRRWGGTREQLITFGKECLATGQWEDGIPPLFINAVWDAAWSLDREAYDATVFEDDELWQSIKSYHEAAQEHGNDLVRKRALNYFAYWGALGGKYADVRPAFKQLYHQRQNHLGLLDTFVFPDIATFLLLHDRVSAHTDEGEVGRLASVKVALLENRLDEAEVLLDNIKPNAWGSSAAVQHYRRSLVLGRELQQQGQLLFKGRHLQHAFDWLNVESLGSVPGQASGRQFTWNPDRNVTYWNDLRLAFPVGTPASSWSGELAWSPDIFYFELTWRLS